MIHTFYDGISSSKELTHYNSLVVVIFYGGTWYVVRGAWYVVQLVRGAWYVVVVLGTWCNWYVVRLVRSAWYVVRGT